MFRFHARNGVSVVALQLALLAPMTDANAQSEQTLPPVTVEAPPAPVRHVGASPTAASSWSAAQNRPRRNSTACRGRRARQRRQRIVAHAAGQQRFQLPQESFSITARQIDETINLKDPEDAVKYFPSLFVRKRNDGDNQAVLATRSWGLNSSARTLIYYDDLLVSALIGNNNSGASPHWNLMSPEAIGRIDFLNGPYSAAYPGNSIGGVLLITSKMPDHAFATVKETVSIEPWNQYGTRDTYREQQHQRGRGQPRRHLVMAGHRQLSGRLSAAADVYDQWLAPRRHHRNLSGAEQAGRCRRRRRHRHARAFAADLGQPQARLRFHAPGPGDLFARESGITSRPPIRRPI